MTSTNPTNRKEIKYRGYEIDCTTYGLISVQYCGDDIIFSSEDAAKAFIDSIIE